MLRLRRRTAFFSPTVIPFYHSRWRAFRRRCKALPWVFRPASERHDDKPLSSGENGIKFYTQGRHDAGERNSLGRVRLRRPIGVSRGATQGCRLPVEQGSVWARPRGLEAVWGGGCWSSGNPYQGHQRHFPGDVRSQVRGSGICPPLLPEKTQATSKRDKEIAEARYRAVANARKINQ